MTSFDDDFEDWQPNDWQQYNEVIDALRESMGLSLDEARAEYYQLSEYADGAPDIDDVVDYVSEYALEAAIEEYPEIEYEYLYEESEPADVEYADEEPEETEVDYGEFDDVWLDEGDEIELSAEYEES